MLTEANLLDLYSISHDHSDYELAQITLQFLYPEMSEETIGDITLGDGERLFWSSRKRIFSSGLEAKVQCAECQSWLEINIGAGFDIPDKTSEKARVEHLGKTYDLRLPKMSDLSMGTASFPYKKLAETAPWDDLKFREKAAAALEAADPGMDVTFAANCADCNADLKASFNAFIFLWSDLKKHARSILLDIIYLAEAFGWSEKECLRLGPARRRSYLDLIR